MLSKSNYNQKEGESDFKVCAVATAEGVTKMAKVFIRPGVHEMLSELRDEGFELILFTAGNKYYMNSICEHVGIKKYFHHMLSREEMRVLADMTTQMGELVKDLHCLLEDRLLKNIVLVDNSEQKGYMQPKNLIPIIDFKGSATDKQLLSLTAYLKELKMVKDVRKSVVCHFHK